MDTKTVDQIIEKHGGKASSLIQMLVDIQSDHNWLPQNALERLSEKLDVPLSRIKHIATFYKAFSLEPKGRNKVHICMGTACHVRGAPRLLDAVQDQLGIGPGETDADLKFSVETVNCIGCCALGPVVEINGESHGRMTPADAREALDNCE